MIRTIWNYLRRDILRRVVALLFAVMIYWSISAQISEERPFTVPIEYQLDSGLIMESASQPATAVITVRGARRDLNDLTPSAIVLRVPVNNSQRISGDNYQVKIQPGDFNLPRGGLRVIRVDLPRNGIVNLQLTRRITRTVRVKPRFAGHLSSNYRLAEWRAIPDEVRISGPESVVADVREVLTELVPLSVSVEESFEYEAPLLIPRHTECQPARVTVQADVVRNVEERTFKQLPVAVMNDPAALFRAELPEDTPRVEVTLTGSAAALNELSSDDVRPFVSGAQLRGEPGGHQVPVEIYVKSKRVRVKSIVPGEIRVNLTRKSAK